MNTFHYAPVLVPIRDSYEIDQSLYVKVFPDHAVWLHDNDISYEVSGFRWPEMLSMLISRDVMVEFEVRIEDSTAAMIFKLFSGINHESVR